MDKNPILNKGIYCLIIKVRRARNIKIGRLGTFHFSTGFYVYLGSAQNSMKHRIKRHLQKEKKLRWHIDYLLQYAEVTDIYQYAGIKAAECILSHKIGSLKNAVTPVKGFGSSDCSCVSHLYFFRRNPKNTLQNQITPEI